MSTKTTEPVKYNPLFSHHSSKGYMKNSWKQLLGLCLFIMVCAPVGISFSSVFSKVFGKGSSVTPQAECGKRVVGYYTAWETEELTREKLGKFTHAIYLFGVSNNYMNITIDDEGKFLNMMRKAKSVNPQIKVMIGIGAHNNDTMISEFISEESASKERLVFLISSFVEKHDIDGVEIFWTWSLESKKESLSKFLQKLKTSLSEVKTYTKRSQDYVISMIVPPSISHLERGYDLNKILEYVDFINVLSWDYYLNDKQSGKNRQMTKGNIDETMKYLACKTRQPSKLNMPIPFYKTVWRNESYEDSSSIARNDKEQETSLTRWNELFPNGFAQKIVKSHEDSHTFFIWIQETNHTLQVESEIRLKKKTKYAKNHNLGGILIWSLFDEHTDKSLDYVTSSDICSVEEKDSVEYLCFD